MFSITSKSDYYGSKAASKRKQIEKQQKQTWEINSSKTAAVKVIARASQKDEMKWFQISNEEENLRVAAFFYDDEFRTWMEVSRAVNVVCSLKNEKSIIVYNLFAPRDGNYLSIARKKSVPSDQLTVEPAQLKTWE